MTIESPAFGEAAQPTRQARSAATRARIVDAAAEAFTTSGISVVSLRDIAARAGITHPGLLRHFSSKDALLGAVVDRLESDNQAWSEHAPHGNESLGFADLARRNARSPGYLELYTALSGEATSATHPAHAHMRDRYARVRDILAAQIAAGPVRAGVEPSLHATLLIAGWDGLQVQQRYAPAEVDLVAYLERHERWLMGAENPVDEAEQSAPAEAIGPSIVVDPEASVSRSDRRDRIVESAVELFARDGYHGTSLRDIAERSGISKSTLLHHVGSKDELLTAVLRLRDRLTINDDVMEYTSSRARLLELAATADRLARTGPGLIELYAVLSCEGATPGHPAHEFFARRFHEGRRYFLSLFRRLRDEGSLRADRDPRHEAAWLMATWDGLQMQWLYDPTIDVGEHLRAHFRDVLVPEDERRNA